MRRPASGRWIVEYEFNRPGSLWWYSKGSMDFKFKQSAIAWAAAKRLESPHFVLKSIEFKVFYRPRRKNGGNGIRSVRQAMKEHLHVPKT